MQYLPLVQRLQALCHMDEGSPDLFLLILGPGLQVFLVMLEDVAAPGNLHDDIERRRLFVVEGLLIADDVLFVVGG